MTRQAGPNRWIVTGCNGYLGGVLCRLLQENGNTVLGVARTGRNVENLEILGIECLTYEMLDESLKPGDVFVHCAGKTGTVGSWEEFESTNVNSSIALFQRASNAGASFFFYVSSVASLGYVNRKDQTVLDDETKPELREGEFYGRSKLLAENKLEAMSLETDTRLVILRPGLIYGRRPVRNQQKWWMRTLLMDPLERIPLCYVDNFYSAMLKIIKCSNAAGKYLVVDDDQPTRKELDNLKIELGIINYRPWIIGKSAFIILQWIRGWIWQARGQRQNSLGESIQAQLLFCGRHSLYGCTNLKEKVEWSPEVSMTEGWLRTAGKSKIETSRDS